MKVFWLALLLLIWWTATGLRIALAIWLGRCGCFRLFSGDISLGLVFVESVAVVIVALSFSDTGVQIELAISSILW